MTKIIIEEISFDSNVETVTGINGRIQTFADGASEINVTYRTDDGSCYGELYFHEDSLFEVKKLIVELFGEGNTNIEEVLPLKKIMEMEE